MSPKVSIIIPVYNGANYLSQAIESALAQSYRNTEILVINDGSTDDGKSARIAEAYGARIRYFSKPNGGVASALNFGIARMSGEYFSWLSHDDLYCPEKIEAQIEYLQGREQKLILYSDYEVFTDDGFKVPVRLPTVRSRGFRCFITLNNSLHGCTLLIPRSAFDVSGTFNESLKTTQDYDLWFRMAECFEFTHIPRVLVRARSHAGQGTYASRGTAIREINTLLSGFIDRLTELEVREYTGKSLVTTYAQFARNMAWRGFLPTSIHASMLSLRRANSGSVMQMCGAVMSIFFVLLCGAPIVVLRELRLRIVSRLRSR